MEELRSLLCCVPFFPDTNQSLIELQATVCLPFQRLGEGEPFQIRLIFNLFIDKNQESAYFLGTPHLSVCAFLAPPPRECLPTCVAVRENSWAAVLDRKLATGLRKT